MSLDTSYPSLIKTPVFRVFSPNSHREIAQRDVEREPTKRSSRASTTSVDSSDSNVEYETSSEGRRFARETRISGETGSRFSAKVEKAAKRPKEKVIEVDLSKAFGSRARDELTTSESLPVLRTIQRWDPYDRSSSCLPGQQRLLSESSHARLKKMQKIAACMDSGRWSESYLSSSVISTSLTDEPRKLESQICLPVLREPSRLRSVTFRSIDDEENGEEKSERDRYSLRKLSNSSRTERIPRNFTSDLIDVGSNPHPSARSFYFPPSPNETPVSDNGPKRTRRFFYSRSPSDFDALSRIEGELGPLQSKLSEITGKVRALNLVKMPYDMAIGYPVSGGVRTTSASPGVSRYVLHGIYDYGRDDSYSNYDLGAVGSSSTRFAPRKLAFSIGNAVTDAASSAQWSREITRIPSINLEWSAFGKLEDSLMPNCSVRPCNLQDSSRIIGTHHVDEPRSRDSSRATFEDPFLTNAKKSTFVDYSRFASETSLQMKKSEANSNARSRNCLNYSHRVSEDYRRTSAAPEILSERSLKSFFGPAASEDGASRFDVSITSQLALPNTEDKIVIVPIIFTDGIPEPSSIPLFRFSHSDSSRSKLGASRQVVLLETKNHETRSNGSSGSSDQSENSTASGSFVTQLTNLAEKYAFIATDRYGSESKVSFTRSSSSLRTKSVSSTTSGTKIITIGATAKIAKTMISGTNVTGSSGPSRTEHRLRLVAKGIRGMRSSPEDFLYDAS